MGGGILEISKHSLEVGKRIGFVRGIVGCSICVGVTAGIFLVINHKNKRYKEENERILHIIEKNMLESERDSDFAYEIPPEDSEEIINTLEEGGEENE